MSLINDALKRAQQARQQNPFGNQPVPLQPVEYGRRRDWVFRALIGLCLVASLAGAGWCLWKWWRTAGQSQEVEVVANAAQAASPSASTTPARPLWRMQPIKVSTNLLVRTNLVAPPPTETPAQATSTSPPVLGPAAQTASAASPTKFAAPAPASPFADLKLQSIIFREDKPAAVINGEMVFVGDEIREARVLKIEPQSVTIERNGETNALRLPRL